MPKINPHRKVDETVKQICKKITIYGEIGETVKQICQK